MGPTREPAAQGLFVAEGIHDRAQNGAQMVEVRQLYASGLLHADPHGQAKTSQIATTSGSVTSLIASRIQVWRSRWSSCRPAAISGSWRAAAAASTSSKRMSWPASWYISSSARSGSASIVSQRLLPFPDAAFNAGVCSASRAVVSST